MSDVERVGHIPQGWKLVPVQPTDDMLISGQEAWATMRLKRNPMEDTEEACAVYRAMLAAAPECASNGLSPIDDGRTCSGVNFNCWPDDDPEIQQQQNDGS